MTPDEYLRRVQALVWLAEEYVSPDLLSFARELVEHGEPAEGLRSLAWVLVREQALVPAEVVSSGSVTS